jgi:outer membrane protein
MSVPRLLRAGLCAVALSAIPVAAHAESVTSALASAYIYSPTLMSALLSVKSAAEDVALAKSGKLPTIAGTANYNGTISSVTSGYVISQTTTVGVTYQQTLFDNFKTDAEIEKARAGVEVSSYALSNEEQNLLLSVAQAYANVARDIQLVQIYGESVSFYDAQVSSADERLRIGEGTKIEVSQATARRAQGVASYQQAIATLQTSQATYQRYVGHKPQSLVLEFPYGRLLPRSIDEAINLSDDNNPAILSARAAIRAAQAGADSAAAQFGPTLDLIGQVCGINCLGGTTQSVQASVRLSLTVPLYAGGALGAGVRKANIAQIKSEVDALDTRDQVRESVISAWASLQNAGAQIESAQAAVDAGQAVLEGLVQERDVGQRTTLDVLNQQADLVTSRVGLVQSKAQRVVAAFSLIAAVGRLTAVQLGLNVEVKSGHEYAAKVEDIWAELRSIDD